MKPTLVQEYVASGKANIEYRDLAFLGPESMDAAQAAACALDQGKFWQYHDTIFENQNGENQGALSKDRLKKMASEMGLNTGTFNQCLDSGSKQSEVTAMVNEARSKGVQRTPSFVINDQLVEYRGYDSLKTAIDAALGNQ